MTRPVGTDNPAAFPSQHRWESGDFMEPANGMSLRDWFAGLIAAQSVGAVISSEFVLNPKKVAQNAYDFADALLLARNGGDGE